MHRLWVPELRQATDHLTIRGDEAEHLARARRARPAEPVALHDGQGLISTGVIEHINPGSRREPTSVTIRLDRAHPAPLAPPPAPVHILTAVPKGGRVDEMIEQLSQVGASAWSPLRCARSIVEPRPAKLDRLERIAVESMKQCGRAWLLKVDDHVTAFADALAQTTILADATGTPALDWFLSRRAQSVADVRILVGPEGGWTPDELAAANARNAPILSFGPHAMRIETAAVVAAALAIQAISP